MLLEKLLEESKNTKRIITNYLRDTNWVLDPLSSSSSCTQLKSASNFNSSHKLGHQQVDEKYSLEAYDGLAVLLWSVQLRQLRLQLEDPCAYDSCIDFRKVREICGHHLLESCNKESERKFVKEKFGRWKCLCEHLTFYVETFVLRGLLKDRNHVFEHDVVDVLEICSRDIFPDELR